MIEVSVRRPFAKALLDHSEVLIEEKLIDAIEGFESDVLTHIIDLTPSGEATGYRELTRLNYKDEAIRGQSINLPKTPRTRGKIACLGFDNPDYVLLEDRNLFIGRLDDIAEHVAAAGLECPALEAARRFYADGFFDQFEKTHLSRMIESFGAPNDKGKYVGIKISFALESDLQPLVAIPSLKPFLIQTDYDNAPIGKCIITGLDGQLIVSHPLIKGLKCAKGTGARLISFNNTNTHSYGLSEKNSTPPYNRVVTNASRALNYLIKQTKQQVVTKDQSVFYFTDDKAFDVESLVLTEQPWKDRKPDFEAIIDIAKMCNLLSSPKDAKSNIKPLDFRVSMVGIQPMSGRLSLSFFEDSKAADLYGRALRWQEDLCMTGEGESFTRGLPIFKLVQALQGFVNKKGVNAYHAEKVDIYKQALFLSALLENHPLPRELTNDLLHAWKSTMHSVRQAIYSRSANAWFEYRDYSRTLASIAKLIINRSKEGIKMTPEVSNENNSLIGYRLGRMFALMVYAQEKAYPDATTLVEAQMGGVMNNPRNTLPRLIRNRFYPHLREIQNFHKRVGLAIKLRKEWSALHADLEVVGYPARLIPAQQLHFITGYEHEKTWLYTKNTVVDESAANDDQLAA